MCRAAALMIQRTSSRAGKSLLGICGGSQMLSGLTVSGYEIRHGRAEMTGEEDGRTVRRIGYWSNDL